MRAELDHLVVASVGLESAVAHVEGALGLPMGPGGAHPDMGTHNRLLSLGATDYLEAIATEPGAPTPPQARFFNLDRYQGPPCLTNWVIRVNDLEAALALTPPGTGRPVALSRGANRWRMAVPEDGRHPFDGLFPSLITWDTPNPAPNMPDTGARLARLILTHPKAEALAQALSPFLDDPRVDILPGPAAMVAEIDVAGQIRVLE